MARTTQVRITKQDYEVLKNLLLEAQFELKTSLVAADMLHLMLTYVIKHKDDFFRHAKAILEEGSQI